MAGRLGLPLLIPYFPVPALLSCLILDAVDQSIFQQFPAIPLDGYQSYDKALDIYYLSIAYLSTLRNWTNQTAFHMSRFLFYYRMLGAVLFEITQARAVLFIFPNTFEYFFLFVELVRSRWDTGRMGRRTVIVAAALIWVVIKLPQEWWIHIAQLDMTDFIKESLFGVNATDSWSTAIGNRPWVLLAAIVAVVAIAAIVYLIIRLKAPKFDHGPRLSAGPSCRRNCTARSRTARSAPRPASGAGSYARRWRSRHRQRHLGSADGRRGERAAHRRRRRDFTVTTPA